MKKFGLPILMVCVGLFAACSDDDKAPNDNATAVAGTYKSDLTITLPGEDPITDEKDFTIIRTGDDLVTLELKNFKFGTISVGDIELTDIPVTKISGGYAFTETTREITLEGLDIKAKVTSNGTVVGNKTIIDLSIDAEGFTTPILVDIEGTKSGNKSTYADISSISFAGDFVISQPSESGTDLTLYIKEGTTTEQLKAVVVTLAVSDKATVSPASGSKIDLSSGSAKFVVTAEDGVTKKEYTVTTKVPSLSFFDFEEWTIVNPAAREELQYKKPTGGQWDSSNTGIVSLMVMPVGNGKRADKFGITPTEDAVAGKAARIETIKTVPADALQIPSVTSGSLYTGLFKLVFSNSLASTKFGVPFTQKPVKVKVEYKYTSGGEFFRCTNVKKPASTTSVDKNTTDECAITAVLYTYDAEKAAADDALGNKNPYSTYLTGLNLHTSSEIVATAKLKDGTAKTAYTKTELNFEYKDVNGKATTFDKNKSYRLAIVTSSSKEGDKFSGAPGSVLYLDNLEIIAE